MDQPQPTARGWWLRCGACGLVLVISVVFFTSASPVRSNSGPTPTPIYFDRLATPVVPENPTPIDLGRQVYYLHCMPCHGDVGQGLTDEWRAVWVDDHQNCWAKGCHGGRIDDEGFPIPRTIPAVIGSEAHMARQATQADFVAYLVQTHPPQRPGKLEAREYEEVTAFLWHENRRDVATDQPTSIWLFAGGVLIAVGAVWLIYRTRRLRNRHEG